MKRTHRSYLSNTDRDCIQFAIDGTIYLQYLAYIYYRRTTDNQAWPYTGHKHRRQHKCVAYYMQNVDVDLC